MIEIFTVIQQLAVYLVVAYLLCKTSALKPLAGFNLLINHKLVIFVIFAAFAIIGTHISLPRDAALLDASVVGIMVAGLAGGLLPGLGVGLVTGLYQLQFHAHASTQIALLFFVFALIHGAISGETYRYLGRHSEAEKLFSPTVTLVTVFLGQLLQLVVFFMVLHEGPNSLGGTDVQIGSMLLINSVAAALFMMMLRDQRIMQDKVGAIFSAKALNIAERSLGILSHGFHAESAQKLAEIIYEETGVSAVGISDCDKILAFVGIGEDHHLPGVKIISPQTLGAIRENRVIYADAAREKVSCALSKDCPLGSALVVPLRADNEVVGTIKLYETRNKLFLNLNKALGEGIANLLSEQLLHDRYESQKNLLVKSELKLIQAQVNPHFLFNALNTIVAVVRKNPEKARTLLLHLSNYFRKNLKRSSDLATLEEELDHVNSYLYIEKARFGDKLQIVQDIDSRLLRAKVPTFTLQPLVENAIKHGISNMIGNGLVTIHAYIQGATMLIEVLDNAGTYCDIIGSEGLGMKIVEKRIQNLYGRQYGMKIDCDPDETTKITLILPYREETFA